MFLFLRLILAHLIGDFLFQFDKVHALKVKGSKGLLLHVGIVMGCLLIVCGPYLDQPITWLLLLFIGVTHYVQDGTKIKLTGHSRHQLFFFSLDQVLHIAFIAIVFCTSLGSHGPLPNPNNNLFLKLYNSNAIILYYISAIIASYAGHYIIILIKKDFFNIDSSYSVFEKWYGFVERIFIVSVIFPGILWPVWVPAILIIRPILNKSMKKTLNLSDQFSSMREIFLSGTLSTVIGFIYYMSL